ncbi:MAG: [Fe-Fe] hydrogenase large subunit C-terminal domain-containing protein [Bacteroidales bacterium]|nr:[Fe-Fe] hydrogenase large subunit C-terminal domain-containing protein [Bacteroidales bacterium]
MEVRIEVNNKTILAKKGESLLAALRDHGIKIPTLCHMNRFSPGACRLCVVEVEGKRDLITSCSFPVEEGIKVKTNTPRVIQARKALVELLLSNHPDDCLYCRRNGNCELQWLAGEMNVKERKFFGRKNEHFPDFSSSSVARDPAKCVLCSRCVRICEEVQLVTALDFISRGNQTMVNSAFNKGLNVSSCIHCGQCVQVCPTAALTDISHIEKVDAALGKEHVKVVFLLSPSATVSFAVAMNLKAKDDPAGIIAAALKSCGAHKVFDLGLASDINVMEEARQLVTYVQNNGSDSGPLLSSCCPAWVRYAEEFRPEWLHRLARTKSPQQIMGVISKTFFARQNNVNSEQLFTVAVMPCVGKKYEASREENTHRGVSEIDAVITVRELMQLLRSHGIDTYQLEKDALDKPFDTSSAAATELGYSGGKAEAVAREVNRLMGGKPEDFKFSLPKHTAGKKETKVTFGDKQLGFAWVSSIREADAYLRSLEQDERQDIHYVEVMACLGGCAGGGGQPVSRGFEQSLARKKMCAELEKANAHTAASENPLTELFYKHGALRVDDPDAHEWMNTKFKKK